MFRQSLLIFLVALSSSAVAADDITLEYLRARESALATAPAAEHAKSASDLLQAEVSYIDQGMPGYRKAWESARAKMEEAERAKSAAVEIQKDFCRRWIAQEHKRIEEKPLPPDPKQSEKDVAASVTIWNAWLCRTLKDAAAQGWVEDNCRSLFVDGGRPIPTSDQLMRALRAKNGK